MNQKERMLANRPYKAWMDGLSEERMENKKRIFRFNNLDPESRSEKDKLLKEMVITYGLVEIPVLCRE